MANISNTPRNGNPRKLRAYVFIIIFFGSLATLDVNILVFGSQDTINRAIIKLGISKKLKCLTITFHFIPHSWVAVFFSLRVAVVMIACLDGDTLQSTKNGNLKSCFNWLNTRVTYLEINMVKIKVTTLRETAKKTDLATAKCTC